MSSSQNSSSSDARLMPAAYAPLQDVVCRVEVMLGTAAMSVRSCIALRPDTIIPLTKTAGGDLEIVVNGILVARGEVLIVDETTAVRVTEVVAPPSSEGTE